MKVAETENEPADLNLTAARLLHSLLDSIPHAQSFKGKWSLIRTKLITLQTHLNDLPATPSAAVDAAGASSNNPLSADLLRALASTLSHALSLCKLCYSPAPPEGKLKTQNDVDSVSAKLDSHIGDFEVLTKSGLLDENAVVFTKKESLRAESRSLVTRLQLGTTESKSLVLDLILGLLQEDDKNVIIAVGQGIVPVLVRLLDSSSSVEIKEKTVTAIARISAVDSGKESLLAEGLGLLNNLLRVVESGSAVAKENSCIALQTLSHSKENARATGSRGGISALLEICQTGTPNSQAMAVCVLKNLAVFEEIKENFIEENAVKILLSLSNSGTALSQENAIGCVCNLIKGDDDLKLSVAREGGIECLLNFWDSAPTVQSLEAPVIMVEILAANPIIAEFLVSNGFVGRIVGVLSCGVLRVRIAAAEAVYDLAFSSKTRKEFGEIGCILPLVSMLEGKAIEEKEAAARALSALLVCPGNRKIFKNEEKGIVNVVQLLDPKLQNLDKKYPVTILLLLSHSRKCRKRIVATGASLHLQKLAEADIEGSKKLLESLGRSKLWGVFARS